MKKYIVLLLLIPSVSNAQFYKRDETKREVPEYTFEKLFGEINRERRYEREHGRANRLVEQALRERIATERLNRALDRHAMEPYNGSLQSKHHQEILRGLFE